MLYEIALMADKSLNNSISNLRVHLFAVEPNQTCMITFINDEQSSKNLVNHSQPLIVKLYNNSDKSLEEFLKDLHDKFKHSEDCSCCRNSNTATNFDITLINSEAVEYILNYFFPKNPEIEELWETYKCLTSSQNNFSLGVIQGSVDIMKKAKLLEKIYGHTGQDSLFGSIDDKQKFN